MAKIDVYINNAEKMIIEHKLSDYEMLLYKRIKNLDKGSKITVWQLIFMPNNSENGLIILQQFIQNPNILSKYKLKKYLSQNWLETIEKECGKKSPIPALYWAVFVKYANVPYEDQT